MTGFKNLPIVLIVFFALPPLVSSAAVTFGVGNNDPVLVDFNSPGMINPQYNVNGTTVSFGALFEGQTLGTMPNEVIVTNPVGPLALSATGPDVATQFDLSAAGLVLGGFSQGQFYTTPIAVLFSNPVNSVSFDLGHLDHAGTTLVAAYDANGHALGVFGNPSQGWQSVNLTESTNSNTISGISIFVPKGGMDWEGFSVDNLSFAFADGDEVIPEPGTLAIWTIIGLVGCVSLNVRRLGLVRR
ncbi:MAG: hypothetical protein R3C28_14625 [Pirellulaceae bacterium]